MIDTHELILKLEGAGFDKRQSRLLVDVLKTTNDDLVTKDYLRAEMSELRAEMSELRAEISEMGAELSGIYAKIMLSQVAIAGLLFTALKLF